MLLSSTKWEGWEGVGREGVDIGGEGKGKASKQKGRL